MGKRKLASNLLLIFVLLLLLDEKLSAQTSYTWNGGTSSAWGIGTNWTPNGIPGAADNVTIVNVGTQPVYDGLAGVTNFTMTSGTLDLGGFTLTSSGTNIFTAGTIQNGTFSSAAATATTFTNTSLSANCTVNITSGTIIINGGTFDGTTTLIQNGATQTTGTGNATFNGTATIECAGSGSIRTNANMTFNGTTQLKVSSSGYLLLELTGANIYNGNVTMTITASGTGDLRSCYRGANQFNGNISLEDNGTGFIYFCEQATATATLATGKTISVGAGGFSSGRIYLYRFTQTGATAQNITLTGSSRIFLGPSSSFGGNATIIAPTVNMDGATYSGTTYIEQNGTLSPGSVGGNIFNGTTTIVNSGSGYILMGNTTADIFNGAVTFNNTGSNYIYPAYNSAGNTFNSTATFNNTSSSATDLRIEITAAAAGTAIFNGDVTINNTSSASTISMVRFSNGGVTTFNGNIICNNTSSASTTNGIYLCWNGISASLASGKTISVGGSGFSTGRLAFTNFTQNGATAQNITLTGTAMIHTRTGTTFNGNVNFIAPQIQLDGATFNGTAYIEKSGATSNAGNGGNTFNSTASLVSSSSGYLGTGWATPDIFNGDLTLSSTGSERVLIAWASAGNQLNGNLIVNSTGSSLGINMCGNAAASITLSATKNIQIGGLGFTSGYLILQRLTQLGSAVSSLTLSSSSNYFQAGPSTTFGGNFSITAPDIYPYGTTYNGTATFTKTGGTNNHNNGNLNIFNSTCTINQQSNAGYFMLGFNSAEAFNDDITVTATGTGNVYLGYVNGTGTPTLAAGKTVLIGGAGFSGGTLLFGGFTQLGTAAINLTLTGSATLRFVYNSFFGGNITSSSPNLLFDGATFNGTVTSTKTGSVADAASGGNTFNGTTTIINSGSAYLGMGWTNPDIFNGDVTFTSSGSQRILPCYNSLGNQFNGNITLNSTGSSVGINFCGNGATASATQAAGKTISIGGSGFTAGYLILQRFTQLGNAAITLPLPSSANYIQLGPVSTFGGSVTATAPDIYPYGATYNGAASFTKTGGTNNHNNGNLNTFNSTCTINQQSTGYFALGYNSADAFNDNITVTSTSTGTTFLGFSSGTGTPTLAAGKTVSVGGAGFSAGTLYFGTFTQLGNAAINLTFTGSATLTFARNSVFGGNITSSTPSLLFNSATFNGTVTSTKTGSVADAGTGGNTFNGTTVLTNTSSSYLGLGWTNPDIFNGDVTFTNSGSERILPAYGSAANQFNGNITVNSTGSSIGINFCGTGPGTATQAATKTISIGGSGFSAGYLILQRFTQLGSAAINLTLAASANYFQSGPSSAFGGAVTVTSPQIFLNGAIYSSAAFFEKTGATNNAGLGSNTFNSTVTMKNSGTGYFMTGNGSPDIFNDDATFTNTGSNAVYIAWVGAGTTFNGNIIANCTAGTGVIFGGNTADVTLAAGKTISIGGSGFSTGELRLRRFTQNGATPQALTLTGTATLTLGTASAFNGNVTFTSPQMYLNGATYNGTATLEKNGATANNGNGGNIFNGTTIIKNSGTGNFLTALTTADTYNADVTFTNTGSSNIRTAYIGANAFNGNIICNSTSGVGVYFCENAAGTATLAAAKTISIGGTGFTTGTLWLQRFTQSGATAQTITQTGTATLQLGPTVSFDGNSTFTCPQMYLNGATFNGTSTLEKNGATNNTSTGGNIFNSTAIIKNSSAAIFRLANATTDDFNGSATFIQTGAGALQPAYNVNCTFAGDISTVGTTTAITFAVAAPGRVTIDGNTSQAFNGASAQTPIVRNLTMSTTGSLSLNVPVNISTGATTGDITFTDGHIITTSTNVLTVAAAATVTLNAPVVQDSSFVKGPLAHVVNVATAVTKVFPVGKSNDYRRIDVTADQTPATSTTYTAEMFNSSAVAFGYTLPGTIANVSGMRYHTITQSAATALDNNQQVRMYYQCNQNSDVVQDLPNLKVAQWNGAAAWLDRGGAATGSLCSGTDYTGDILSGVFNTYNGNKFTLANGTGGTNPLPVELLSFNAKPDGNTVDINWTTTSEKNCDYFSVEKSQDGNNFTELTQVKGAGNSSTQRFYQQTDYEPYQGISYYRLKQTDYNGEFYYSQTVAVNFNGIASLSVFPSPSSGDFNISLGGEKGKQVLLVLRDVLDREYYSKAIILDNNFFIQPVNLAGQLAPGIYVVTASSDDKVLEKRIVIK